jgi:hypothetical protein
MKRPKPTAPFDAPEGTVQLGGPIQWFAASLTVNDDDLEPDQVTRLLGQEPTRKQCRGVPLLRADGSVRSIPQYGRWVRELKPSQTDEWDITEIVYLLFEGLPHDLSVWHQVAALGKIRVTFGLNIPDSSRDFELAHDLMRFLSERRASIWFDIYCEQEDVG